MVVYARCMVSPTRAGLIALLFLLIGCPKPTVDAKNTPGEPGEFCVSKADCGAGECDDQVCCEDASCSKRCTDLMSRDGSRMFTSKDDPLHYRATRRMCLELCCAGADEKEIRQGLVRAQLSPVGHGSAPVRLIPQ